MSDQPSNNSNSNENGKNKPKPLSEISHLFLSSIREKQGGGAQRPVRKPPQAQPAPNEPAAPTPPPMDDLTPEEYAHVFAEIDQAAASDRAAHVPSISAIVGSHLNGRQFDRVKEYARHICRSQTRRVGLIEVDASEFRLMCFDLGPQVKPDAEDAFEAFDAHEMAAAIEEMNFDIDHWILALPSPRTPEARALLREVSHWVLLSTCDHDGVVAAYRTLKGLVETTPPRLSLAMLDAKDDTEVGRVVRKLSGVCQQFLHVPIEAETAVETTDEVAEHLVMFCRPTRDKAQLATAPQWQVVSNFVAKLKAAMPTAAPTHPAEPNRSASTVEQSAPGGFAQTFDRSERETSSSARATAARVEPMRIPVSTGSATTSSQALRDTPVHAEVIDLPSGDASEAAIVTTVLAQSAGELVECPLRAPMCESARLAVTRERGLVLLAVSRQGLADLRAIALAYRWMCENRALIAMALPQFAIDAHVLPGVQLLVDHADASADTLQPLLESSHFTIRTYRTLRWGEKIGLLLDAA